MISKNIRYLREAKKLSQGAVAEDLDITRARLVTYESGRNEPPIEILLKLSDYFHISVDALLKGDLTKTNPEALMKVGKNRILFPVTMDKEGNDYIEIIPAKASAGYLRGYADPEYVEGLQKMKLPFLPTGKHRAFPIKGDSMPPVKEGSYVIGKYVESLNEIRDGNTYVLLTKDEGIVYKRIFSDKDGTLVLSSDNKMYAPYKVNPEDVLEAWEYTCAINTSAYKEEELNPQSIMSMFRSLQVQIERIKK